jgi:type IV secretion system protein VirB11
MAEQQSLYQRQLSNLDHDLRPIMAELLDPRVTDIMVNPGGKLWTKKFGEMTCYSGRSLDRESVLRIIMSTAALIEKKVTKDQWNLTGVIPKYNARIEAFIEPTVSSPTFCLRKPTMLALALDDYVRDGRLSALHEKVIAQAVTERANILVGGGTGTGKTTFLNALISEVARARPDDRLYLVEDTPEINCQARNFVSLVVGPNESIKAVRSALRYKPDRIIFGELRYGEVALEWLKASSTGHPGGMCTVHADSATRMLPRMRDLLLECFSGAVPLNIIYEAIGLCVYLQDIPGFGPRVVEVARVQPSLDAGGNFQYTTY